MGMRPVVVVEVEKEEEVAAAAAADVVMTMVRCKTFEMALIGGDCSTIHGQSMLWAPDTEKRIREVVFRWMIDIRYGVKDF